MNPSQNSKIRCWYPKQFFTRIIKQLAILLPYKKKCLSAHRRFCLKKTHCQFWSLFDSLATLTTATEALQRKFSTIINIIRFIILILIDFNNSIQPNKPNQLPTFNIALRLFVEISSVYFCSHADHHENLFIFVLQLQCSCPLCSKLTRRKETFIFLGQFYFVRVVRRTSTIVHCAVVSIRKEKKKNSLERRVFAHIKDSICTNQIIISRHFACECMWVHKFHVLPVACARSCVFLY